MQYRWRKGFKNANEVAKFIAPFSVTKQEKLLEIVNHYVNQNRIKYKKPIEEKKEELHEKDRPRYEEQSEEEYLRHCKRFFKGWDDDKVE